MVCRGAWTRATIEMMSSSYTQVVELEWAAERQAMLRVARRREEEARAARHIERARAKLQAISYSFYGQVPRPAPPPPAPPLVDDPIEAVFGKRMTRTHTQTGLTVSFLRAGGHVPLCTA